MVKILKIFYFFFKNKFFYFIGKWVEIENWNYRKLNEWKSSK
jgi:hypothetical protein